MAQRVAPAPLLLFLYLGNQSRFFARWLLPIYPILCLLAFLPIPVIILGSLRYQPTLQKRYDAVRAAAGPDGVMRFDQIGVAGGAVADVNTAFGLLAKRVFSDAWRSGPDSERTAKIAEILRRATADIEAL